ncbi:MULTISPECIES: virulence factor [Exiguobacterium]|uniref:virulence factor n=1 Tax=Exiguobacterium TaxID=33986 RepID=UPI000494BB42|nr:MULTISPECIES: virulence factor [Exiguobacterium]
MKIVAIEPTPSPNNMKVIVDETFSEKGQTFEHAFGAPEHVTKLLDIPGIKSVYQVSDFLAVERFPKYDWRTLVIEIRRAFGENLSDVENHETDAAFEPVHLFVQFILGVPMQIKGVKGLEEKRQGLPERFRDAALFVQPFVQNVISDRRWVEQAPRYGELDDSLEEVAQELEIAYPQERVERLKVLASGEDVTFDGQALSSSDWKERFAALDELPIDLSWVSAYAKMLQDEKMQIRRQAIVKLGMFEENREELLEYITNALHDPSGIVRRTAGDTVSDWALPEAEPMMIEALTDKNKLVRWRAARFLFDVGTERAVSRLKEAAQDKEYEVALQAELALARIESGEEALGTVWQQMNRLIDESS